MVNLSTFGLAALLPAAMAQIQYVESQSSLMFNMSTVKTSSGTDIHFNMSIPKSNGWGAIGIGTMMADALIFLLLPDSTNGSTISLRTATGHVMPRPVQGMTLDVMSGSANGDIYMASAICRSCQTWSDGSLDASSTSQPFVYSVGPGPSGVSGSGQSATIMMHSYHGNFNVDMTKAAASSSNSASPNSGSGQSASGGSSSSGVSASSMVVPPPLNLVKAHASIFGITFGILLPLGVVLLRVDSLGWVPHAAVQGLGSVLAVAGLGIAIHMSLVSTPFRHFSHYHQIVGLVTISLLLLNAFAGMAHHVAFLKVKKRTAVTYFHLWVGRAVMLLGVLNLIFGLILTQNTAGAIGVGVAGLFVYLATFAIATFLKLRSRKSTKIVSEDRGNSVPGEVHIVSDKPVNGNGA